LLGSKGSLATLAVDVASAGVATRAVSNNPFKVDLAYWTAAPPLSCDVAITSVQ
jgi:hypothetical protein